MTFRVKPKLAKARLYEKKPSGADAHHAGADQTPNVVTISSRLRTLQTAREPKNTEIRHKVGCKTRNALYLGFCIKCNKKQYVGKVESQGANKRINKHRNDAKRSDSIGIDKHFLEPGHDFNRDFRMIVIEEITQTNMTKEQTRLTLLKREDFWIKKLGTLEPNGFNDRLNFPEN